MVRQRLAATLMLATLAGAGLALPAEACGGLFCSRVPVDQAGEKILFATDGENVTAYVQIQYTGDAKDFSWIVPVPTTPHVALGSDQLFTQLRNTTRPSFTIDVKDDGPCLQSTGVGRVAVPQAAAGAAADSGVSVVSQEQLGAFDVATLSADDPGALKKWLTDNGYVIPDKLDPLLDPYVNNKYDFVAVKLQKNASVGDIQPIVLKYKSTKPGIPIRLTGIAATPDMDVYVWVMGQHRAIPENYRHAVINEARIDWLNYAPSNLNDNRYRETVTAAMNEAGGQAFVTDYAGDSSAVDISGFDASQFSDVTSLAQITDPVAFVKAVVNGGYFNQGSGGPRGGFLLPGYRVSQVAGTPTPGFNIPADEPTDNADDQYLPVNAAAVSFFKRFVPMPESLKANNLSDFDFYSRIGSFRGALAAAQETVDAVAAEKALVDQVVQPYQDINAMFKGSPYLTALYTTMSPDEMTQDPTFIFNADLPKVSNVHHATGVRHCSNDVGFMDAPMDITLANGLKYTVARNLGAGVGIIQNGGTPQPSASAKPVNMPAADRIEQLKGTGLASVITNNRDLIATALGILKGSTVSVAGQTFGFDDNGKVVSLPGKKTASATSGFGCAGCSNTAAPVKQGADEGATYALVVLGFLGYRRWLGKRKR